MPAAILAKLRVYGSNPLSRTRSKWDDVKKNLSPSDFLPNDDDYDRYSVRWLSMIDLALIAPHAPTVEEARRRLQDETFFCDERKPDDIGIHCQDVLLTKDMEMATALQPERADDMGDKTADNKYDRNYIATDNTINNNLSRKDVVENLIDGGHRVHKDVTAKDKTEWNEGPFGGEKPIAEDFGTVFATDGDPAIQGLRILRDKDGSYSVFMKAGGFHYLLKAYNGCGHTFDSTHFGWMVHRYRKTEKQKEWVLFPSDPNQIDENRTGENEACAEEIHDFFCRLRS